MLLQTSHISIRPIIIIIIIIITSSNSSSSSSSFSCVCRFIGT